MLFRLDDGSGDIVETTLIFPKPTAVRIGNVFRLTFPGRDEADYVVTEHAVDDDPMGPWALVRQVEGHPISK